MAETAITEFTAQEIEEGKVFAGIGYVGILFLVPLLAKPENKFCRAHAKQGLVLFGAWVISSVVPILGWTLGYVFCLVLMIMGLINGFSGKYAKLPLIGGIGEKLNL